MFLKDEIPGVLLFLDFIKLLIASTETYLHMYGFPYVMGGGTRYGNEVHGPTGERK